MADSTTDVPPIVTPAYLDKGLWLVVLTPLLAILSGWLHLSLSAPELVGVVLPVVTYIVMHKWKTATLTAAALQAGATAAAAVTSTSAAANVLRGGQ